MKTQRLTPSTRIFFVDPEQSPWLVFGSTIGGIKLIELDPLTGKAIAERRVHNISAALFAAG